MINLSYKGITFDSQEEIFVAFWLEELKIAGIVKSWNRCMEPIPLTQGLKISYEETIVLKTKTKTVKKDKILLRPSEYTYDFDVTFKPPTVLFSPLYDKFRPDAVLYGNSSCVALLEVKPAFDMQNMERGFVHKQKYVWEKYQIFVNLVEPLALFKNTFLPLQCEPYFRYKVVPKKAKAKEKKVGDWKFDWKPKTLKEFLNGNN